MIKPAWHLHEFQGTKIDPLYVLSYSQRKCRLAGCEHLSTPIPAALRSLLSLVIALTGLAYNRWRNEQTESNRNVRVAGVQLLLMLGELDRVIFFSHYDHDQVRGNPRSGRAYVLTIRDLGTMTGAPVDAVSADLVGAWENDWFRLDESSDSANRISAAIDEVSTTVLTVLGSLD